MSNSYSYTAELEQLIINTLLPAYKKYCKENNLQLAIDPKLLQQLQDTKQVAALLRPKEI